MLNRQVLDDYIEEKLLHLHTAFLGRVTKAISPTDIDVQPLTLTKQQGKNAKQQAILTGLSCLKTAWTDITEGAIVLCVVCERDITEAKKGNSAVPKRGRHQMKDSVIIGTISQ